MEEIAGIGYFTDYFNAIPKVRKGKTNVKKNRSRGERKKKDEWIDGKLEKKADPPLTTEN
jgi:hypothetical protein